MKTYFSLNAWRKENHRDCSSDKEQQVTSGEETLSGIKERRKELPIKKACQRIGHVLTELEIES